MVKCQPLCLPCHCLKPFQNTEVSNQFCSRVEKVNGEKLKVGKCQCGCEDVVKPTNTVTFDWAHNTQTDKKYNMSSLIFDVTNAEFDKLWKEEREKCQLYFFL